MRMTSTVNRVPKNTNPELNARIAEGIKDSIEYYSRRPGYEIDRRLEELEQEWDIERMLQVNASTLAFAGSVLALTFDKRFAVLPLAVGAFLLQHAVQGWCPPLNFFRQLGFRTSYEIDEERYALKALRGDFDGLSEEGDSELKVDEIYQRIVH